jgi:hypothetical protein
VQEIKSAKINKYALTKKKCKKINERNDSTLIYNDDASCTSVNKGECQEIRSE